jgi:hypothetical protein
MTGGAFCPSCGVAVVPGYVKCPKCHKALPRRATTAVVGGTAVDSKSRGPLLAVIAGALVLGAIVAYLGLRSTKSEPRQQAAAAPVQAQVAQPETPTETLAAAEVRPTAPTTPDPGAVASDLERNLRKLRLWSTVSVEGSRVDVRSGSCGDPAMAPVLDTSVPSFKAAGLTKLRCLEQSGRVVSDRDL